MWHWVRLSLVLGFCAAGSVSFAQSSTSATLNAEASGESKSSLREALGNRQFQDDHQITDAKLKAENGSLSRYSLKFNVSYFGPTLDDLSVKDQPNPDGSVGTYSTALGGSMAGRYRLDPETAVSMGTGLKALHPFHGMDRTDVNNPYLSYDMLRRTSFGLQMRNSPGVSAITNPDYLKVGEYGAINWDNSLVYDLGTSGFALGLDTSLGYYFYNRGYEKKDGKANRYTVSTFPNVKYNVNDRFSVNTSVGLSWWNPRARADQWSLLNKSVTQRLGLGYGITRSVYFAPYVSFYPNRITADSSTFNFSTIFSIL